MKIKLSKIMVGALSGTILLESCTNGYYLNYDVDDINETLSKSSTVFNNKALPINVTFSDEQWEYLIFLQTLAQDILSDSSTAKSFISNPQEYVQSKGFTCEINIDSKLTQIILALADDEICKAIESGDISTYLNLLKRKGLIDNISISELNQLKDYTSTLNKAMNMSRAANQEMVSASFFAFAAAVLVGVAAVVWAVVIEHFGAANAVAAATAIVWKVGAVTSGSSIRTHSDAIMTTKVMKIWDLKSQDPNSTYLVADQFTSKTVDSLIEYFKENMPELYNQTDLTVLRNAIIANIQNLPYEE